MAAAQRAIMMLLLLASVTLAAALTFGAAASLDLDIDDLTVGAAVVEPCNTEGITMGWSQLLPPVEAGVGPVVASGEGCDPQVADLASTEADDAAPTTEPAPTIEPEPTTAPAPTSQPEPTTVPAPTTEPEPAPTTEPEPAPTTEPEPGDDLQPEPAETNDTDKPRDTGDDDN